MRIFFIGLLLALISSVKAEDTGFLCEVPGQFEEQKNLKVYSMAQVIRKKGCEVGDIFKSVTPNPRELAAHLCDFEKYIFQGGERGQFGYTDLMCVLKRTQPRPTRKEGMDGLPKS
ncbi:MAG: hypothetical protein CBC09_00770 [Cellvibrionales bacterium TMED49]|nr:hypothetical protein [Porticoccaceae bacterium]OUU40207.1 MAG: hypothetical protein CBC09_00770 [Cellvibrionales bacterium TMED49]RPG91280.1 MAG: hypothetical protein CBD08_003595 [Cellvibrionales bacterium TMED148]|tara:strand:- start:2437 stop:2784 length:348 start_codon:yes stop_codon:yes gene_type:complete